MRKLFLSLCAAGAVSLLPAHPQTNGSNEEKATVRETMQSMQTYPFSDPDPSADPSDLFYPYFRFDGFAAKGVQKEWKTVELENAYIRLSLFPEIGGKIWGAVDKTSDKAFIYYNHAVKFRDIAMRGPWTSGGIEFNFGIIGHAPTSSTPVDYLTREKDDGSVSCYIASYDWITRTVWQVEVNLPKDKAYFTTTTTWYNQSSLDQPYYQWMNAGYKAAGNAQFCYPGNRYIGHGGDAHSFPVDAQGRDLSWYENNNFGNSKSYHILGYYNDYYGVYWHDDDFGSVHHADYDEKLGMKIFLWGLSREGGIWEDLLTDTDGQYIELQSGRMYNQPASNSAFTPYKHASFGPQATDRWTEYWFPVKGIQGISKASRTGALHVVREEGQVKLAFSPLQTLSTTLTLYNDDRQLRTVPLQTEVLQPWTFSLPETEAAPSGHLRIVIGNHDLVYTERKDEFELSRPTELPASFDWESAYGLYTQGEQWMNQKVWDKAEQYLRAALEKEASFPPALIRLASLYYREGRYDEALPLLRQALAIDAYDGEANYLYGLCNRTLGHTADAKDGFSVASYSPAFRSAAYTALAEIYLQSADWNRAIRYALRSLEYNETNLIARQVLMVAYRKSGQTEKAAEQIGHVLAELPLYHFARFEKTFCAPETERAEAVGRPGETFTSLVRNELPFETYMEMAGWYESVGCTDESLSLLAYAGDYPIALYKTAYLLHGKGDEATARTVLEKANAQSPRFVFPFRPETLKALSWAASVAPDWKIAYYEGLIYWTNRQTERARACFETCGDPDYAPFYLTRARLKEGDARLQDLLKAERTERSWRTGFALLDYYADRKLWQEAAETGKSYMKAYPQNYYIGLKYAKALCETGQYAPCIRLLDRLQVLPNEGSYSGRAVYRSAHLYQAMDYLRRGKPAQAVASIEASKAWPENLGVGKPYDNQIDSRLEDYLEACAAAAKGDTERAKSLLSRVAAYPVSSRHFESGHLLTALALRESGQKEKADALVASWDTAYGKNRIAAWCAAVYRGETERAVRLLDSRGDPSDTTPWETSFRDVNFDLIIRLFSPS